MERALISQLANKIVRAKDMQNGRGPIQFARSVLASPQWAHLRRYIPVSEETVDLPLAVAEVWQGGWVVSCPLCRGGLEYGDPEEPSFLCCSCWNAVVGGKLLTVKYPTQVAEIEAMLVKRPNGRMRGWLKNESMAALKKQNKKLGVI